MEWTPKSRKVINYPPHCIQRIHKDVSSMLQDPPPGILAMPDDSDLTLIHALITGAADTPYEGGFFYFLVKFPPEYPIRPPRVQFMTTGGSSVRLNPNLYKNGKVCLSILGTWEGPTWSPAQTLESVLISIQSLLSETPYHNEPGFEKGEFKPGDVKRYNDIIQHETLRVAVIGMVNNDYGLNLPPPLREAIKSGFLEYYDTYESLAKSKLPLTGTKMCDPFGERRGDFQWAQLLERLKHTHSLLGDASRRRYSTDTSLLSSPESNDP